ncbi:replication protein C [Rhodobacteraceae bacterium RKSG542]|uniref:plasmid replication protein RepC n=1 Tax=Pseudovibrio flavus TaxID=2529854 RepID=UPI0012BCEE84|nr:plasmid replication protein RepC [Pseudovibrio flavus]MTI16172.1 replication protein C [Pseudovibrio flavus]
MHGHAGTAGFRKLTPAMIASQRLAMANDIVKTTKAEVALALKKAAPALGIDGTTYHILDILIGLTVADDWQPERRPIVAISNEKLSEYVCRSTRTVIRSIRKLVEAGVLAYRDSPTGRRYIHRGEFKNGKQGEIRNGFGLDFSPSRQRIAELKQIGDAFARKLAAEKEAKRTVTRLSRAIADMERLAFAEGIDLSAVSEAMERLSQSAMMPVERAESLTIIFELATDIISEHAEASAQGNSAEFSNEMPCADDIEVTSYNNTNPQNSLINSKIERRSSNDDHSKNNSPANSSLDMAPEKDPISNSRASASFAANAATSAELRGALSRTLKPHSSYQPVGEADLSLVSIGLLSAATSQVQQVLGLQLDSWKDLAAASDDLRLAIGLSANGWDSACASVGDYLAGAILAVTVEKAMRDPDAISSPAGYFRACVDRAQDGKLALHKSLFGLAAS